MDTIKFRPERAKVDVNPQEKSGEAIEAVAEGNINLVRDLLRQGMSLDNALNQVFSPVLKNATRSEQEAINKAIFQVRNSLAQEKEL